MKAKLIKKDGNYFLWSHDWNPKTKEGIIANTYDKPSGEVLQLSLKNCQAIERGYDLDELAEKAANEYNPCNNDYEQGFKHGFQKALEILGDRRFTEEDVIRAMQDYSLLDISEDKIIQSLQQNEWEVEVEMMLAPKYYGYVPKLDADGCLILKRVV